MFTELELASLAEKTFVDRVDYHLQLDSTNNRALELARQHPAGNIQTLVLAEKQTAGRGRGQNQWWSSEGTLTFSLLLGCNALGLPVKLWPMISLSTGLAVAEAIEQFLPGTTAQVKWPNDVYLNDRKVSGILAESSNSRQGYLILGIGINVNNSFDGAPFEVSEKAASLCAIAQCTISEAELLVAVLQRLEHQLQVLGTDPHQLHKTWSKRCILAGEQIAVVTEHSSLEGICQGIDSDGALLLDTATGSQRCLSGVVQRVIFGKLGSAESNKFPEKT